MASTDHESKTTTDHATIKQWAESRNGYPATVADTESKGGEPGILRIDFEDPSEEQPNTPDSGLHRITWEEFFEKFDDADVQFLYQEHTSDGSVSRFCKFISEDD
ncbi:hypothetical protein [Alienimonas sp. DA493]|uniref:hypothetical protein n=1 Tax=Alienimonas sp. DA493 TaxID=3373605 RepID=UPI0037549466